MSEPRDALLEHPPGAHRCRLERRHADGHCSRQRGAFLATHRTRRRGDAWEMHRPPPEVNGGSQRVTVHSMLRASGVTSGSVLNLRSCTSRPKPEAWAAPATESLHGAPEEMLWGVVAGRDPTGPRLTVTRGTTTTRGASSTRGIRAKAPRTVRGRPPGDGKRLARDIGAAGGWPGWAGVAGGWPGRRGPREVGPGMRVAGGWAGSRPTEWCESVLA